MKAAIVTFQGAENYGAVLQVYSMSKWLSKQGIEPEIINYDSRILFKIQKMGVVVKWNCKRMKLVLHGS